MGVRATVVLLALGQAQAGAPAPRSVPEPSRVQKAIEAADNGMWGETLRFLQETTENEHIAEYVKMTQANALFATGEFSKAMKLYETIAKGKSWHKRVAQSRVADCLWAQKQWGPAAKLYGNLIGKRIRGVDRAAVSAKVVLAHLRTQNPRAARKAFVKHVTRFPAHPSESQIRGEFAERNVAVPTLGTKEQTERAQTLIRYHEWRQAYRELTQLTARSRKARKDPQVIYVRAMSLFKMRRRYEKAGRMLLSVYPKLGRSLRPKALFHGARALSRADKDLEAIRHYQKLVANYPRSSWAAEAQYLSGWLHFNMGNYKESLPHLERLLKKYPRSKWANWGRWFLAYSYYQLGDYASAAPLFEKDSKNGKKLRGGKAHYWWARSLQKQGNVEKAFAEYEQLIGRFPFSWYALLAQSRLREAGKTIPPFGKAPNRSPALALEKTQDFSDDALIRKVKSLRDAGLVSQAAKVLRDGEKAFVRRHSRGPALGYLLDYYRQLENFNRPWMIAEVYGRKYLSRPPKGTTLTWWQHAYPQAFAEWVQKYRSLGNVEAEFIWAIMRKESGYNPNTLSYANAMGLLQMIPATTKRVADELGLTYSSDFLYNRERNIQVGCWYIGRLLQKFNGQVPIGAGSFNSGPRPVMEWLEKRGSLPMDEWVELVPYSQTREYMKKVTENYARYIYLYRNQEYKQPLTVNPAYQKNRLTY